VIRFLYRAAWKLAIPLARRFPGSSRIARAARGRAGGADALAAWAREHRTHQPLVWFHAASVGEGRQAEAAMLVLRSLRPHWQVIHTFASPSAEEFSRSLRVDHSGYLPADSVADVARALGAVKPTALVFAATDLWPELVTMSREQGVGLALIAATLAPTSSRRGYLARLLLADAYAALDAVGAIDVADAERLAAIGARRERIVVTGDSRHDSAAARAAALDRSAPHLVAIAATGGPPLLVAGSTWPADEKVLAPALAELRARAPFRAVIAPHQPSATHLAALHGRIAAAEPEARVVTLSELTASGQRATWDYCLVDSVGVLADLYAGAAAAYVGGGFHSSGLHSVIEPAAHGVPVVFGPRRHGSRDARLLLEAGAARQVAGAGQLATALHAFLSDPAARGAAAAAALRVLDNGRGAARRSAELIVALVEGQEKGERG
jgi:3-deoxy-D-manno-octulosonic-acid transferase